MTRCRAAAGALVLLSSLASNGCSRPLPEEGSTDATLYAARCGTCHRSYQPRTLTAAMWKVQVDRMDGKSRAAGMPVPTAAEREQILQYLTRNAGG